MRNSALEAGGSRIPNQISRELEYWPLVGGMPKKSKWGENPKAVEAKQKKEARKIEEEVRKQKALEDEYWRDDDKYVKRKEERKVYYTIDNLYYGYVV